MKSNIRTKVCGRVSATATYVPSTSGKSERNSIRFWIEYKEVSHEAFCFDGTAKVQIIIWQETEQVFEMFRGALEGATRLTCKDIYKFNVPKFLEVSGRLEVSQNGVESINVDGRSRINPVNDGTYDRVDIAVKAARNKAVNETATALADSCDE